MKTIAPGTMLHPGIASNFKKNREKALQQKGVTMAAESVEKPKENQGTSTLAVVDAVDFLNNPVLEEEVFGPYSLLVKASDLDQLKEAVLKMPGQLTATVIGEEDELIKYAEFIQLLAERAGRLI